MLRLNRVSDGGGKLLVPLAALVVTPPLVDSADAGAAPNFGVLRYSLQASLKRALPAGWCRHGCRGWLPVDVDALLGGADGRYVLRSASDGQCVRLVDERPRLRFGPCAGVAGDTLVFSSLDGERLASEDFSTTLYLPEPPPLEALSSQQPEGAGGARRQTKVCLDKRCVRCLARGNANAVRIVLCALSGYEPFVLPTRMGA